MGNQFHLLLKDMLFKYIFSIPVVINGEESIFIDDTLEFNEKDHIVINHTHRKKYTVTDEELLSIKSGCIPIKADAPRVPTPEDKVNHPGHYTWLKQLCGIEVIDITRHMDFDLGNAIKYILRCGHKEELGYSNKEKTIEDLRKAIFYINDKIEMLERQ